MRDPRKIMSTANTIASAVSTPKCNHWIPAAEASPATTARSTIPKMSSNTAAPRMILAGLLSRTPRSPSTRAVMPTLVATMAAPTNVASVVPSPRNHM